MLPDVLMSGKRKPRARTISRSLERDQRKLQSDKLKLASLSDGGSAQRPFAVESASVVESRAASLPCVVCNESCHVVSHDALTDAGERLRRVEVCCSRCATHRRIYFRLVGSALN